MKSTARNVGVPLFCATLLASASAFAQASVQQGTRTQQGNSDPQNNTAANFSQRFTDLGLSLTRTLSGEGRGQGAAFSYGQQQNQDGQFSSQFALAYRARAYEFAVGQLLTFEASVEGNLRAPDNNANNVLNFRPQMAYFWVTDPEHGPWSESVNLYTRFGPLYEASSNFDVQNFLFEVETAPSFSPWAISVTQPVRFLRGVSFRMQPILNFQAGQNIRGRALTNEPDRGRLRITPIIGATLFFTDITQALGVAGVSLSVENRITFLPLESQRNVNNYFLTSFDIALTPSAGFGVSYETGYRAPDYRYTSTFLVSLKLRLGRPPGVDRAFP